MGILNNTLFKQRLNTKRRAIHEGVFVENNFQICSYFILTGQVFHLFSCSGFCSPTAWKSESSQKLIDQYKRVCSLFPDMETALSALYKVLGIPGHLPMGLCFYR